MDKLTTVKKGDTTLVSVRAYKGDAMTLLAMSLDDSITKNFTGFTIKVTPPQKFSYYLFNRFTYEDDVLKKNGLDPKDKNINLTNVSPLQIFRWVHTPGTNHNINEMIFGKYTYEITPRYMQDDILLKPDDSLTVSFDFDIHPYESKNLQIAFTRGFIESQAYTRHFGLNNKIRPDKTDLIFDITKKAGPLAEDKKKNPSLKDYTFEVQHTWLGWQARKRIIDLLEETLHNTNMQLDVFAFDLDEPVICDTIIKLAEQGRARIILDNSKDHTKPGKLEIKFDALYKLQAKDKQTIVRGCFGALAHTKVFVQKLKGKPVKVLTGSTNFSTNGLYINANHVIIFNNKKVAALYEDVFEKSFGQALMDVFSDTDFAQKDNIIKEAALPDMTIRFSPHKKATAQKFFDAISQRILAAKSDVLFAVMNDHSASSILDAIRTQLDSDKIFTYGITDVTWINKYYNKNDLKMEERIMLIS